MNILIITLCWNEEDILPFVLQYWCDMRSKLKGNLKAIVYDNGSTDSSVEILSKYDWIEIKPFDTGNKKDNDAHKDLKNKCWKEYKNYYDLIIVCDIDEILYLSNPEATISKMKDGGYNILATPWYALCEDSKPQYEEGKLLHTLCTKFYKQKSNHMKGYETVCKFNIFDPKLVNDMGWSVGNHIAHITPNKKILTINKEEGFCLHICAGFGYEYKYNRNQLQQNRLSDKNKQKGYSRQYNYDLEKVKMNYKEHQRESFNINEKG